jgi:hypothetical protein
MGEDKIKNKFSAPALKENPIDKSMDDLKKENLDG